MQHQLIIIRNNLAHEGCFKQIRVNLKIKIEFCNTLQIKRKSGKKLGFKQGLNFLKKKVTRDYFSEKMVHRNLETEMQSTPSPIGSDKRNWDLFSFLF